MTPDRPLPDDLPPDELASAHVDGLATPEQVARIEADPDLAGRVARLQAARDAVRTPDVPPDPDRREAAIAAALAAAGPSTATAAAPIVDLSARRRAASRRLGWAAAVAAAVALALVLPRVLDRDQRSQDTTVAAAPKSSSGSSGDQQRRAADSTLSMEADANAAIGSAGAGAGAAPDVGSTMATPDVLAQPPVDLGSADDLEDLVGPARRAIADGAPADAEAAPPSPQDATCLGDQAEIATAPSESGGAAPTIVLSATASVDGERVLVLVVERSNGSRELVAIRAAGCELLGTVGL